MQRGIKLAIPFCMDDLSNSMGNLSLCTDLIQSTCIIKWEVVQHSNSSFFIEGKATEGQLYLSEMHVFIIGFLENHLKKSFSIHISLQNQVHFTTTKLPAIAAIVIAAICEAEKSGIERVAVWEYCCQNAWKEVKGSLPLINCLFFGGLRIRTIEAISKWERCYLPKGLFFSLVSTQMPSMGTPPFSEPLLQRMISWVVAGIKNDLSVLEYALKRSGGFGLPEGIIDLQPLAPGIFLCISTIQNVALDEVFPENPIREMKRLGVNQNGFLRL
jgi:hypothetical protein